MLVRWLTLAIVPIIILLTPVPAGLTPEAWKIFAVYCASILGLILRPASESVVMITVIAFGSLVVPVGKMLSGYASTTVWLVFSAFLISQAFADTGLGKRVAYLLIGRFGKSAMGLVYSETITDFLLSPATPSNTARSGGIVYPIFRNVASALGSEPGPTGRKIGAFLTLSTYGISMSTSALFITACAPNVLTVAFAKNIMKVDISWMQWMVAFIVPGLLVLIAVPYIIYKMYPPEMTRISNAGELSRQGLAELGPITSKEKLLIVVFILAIIGWATGNITKIDATVIALLFFSICAIFKLISWDNVLKNTGAWSTLIWYGAIIGLSGILAQAKFFTWLAKLTADNVHLAGFNVYLVLFTLVVISLLVRYIFASMGAYVGAFIPVLFTIGLAAQAPAMPLALLIASSAAYGCLLTHYGGAVGPVLFGTGYVDQKTWWKVGAVLAAFNVAVYMIIGLPYWKIIGLW
jgi:DASS family divalent anion:Na+ symporter